MLTSAMKRNILNRMSDSLTLVIGLTQHHCPGKGQHVLKYRQLSCQLSSSLSAVTSVTGKAGLETQLFSTITTGSGARHIDADARKSSVSSFVTSHSSRKYGPWNQTEFVPDLKRFLSEIGTDPKEARFWLRQFLNIDQKRPFAVVEVDSEVFTDLQQLDHLASALSFLQRNALQPVIVFGNLSSSTANTSLTVQALRSASINNSCLLCDLLENQGACGRVLFAGSSVIQAESSNDDENITAINSDLIKWCFMRQTIPVIPAFGETSSGQILPLRLWTITSAIAKALHPLKVIKVNCTGGFQDEKQHVIPNISLPFDFHSAKGKLWCTQRVMDTVQEVSDLLYQLPEHTSVVITAADKVLVELFTHRGSGTFLKITEPINKYHSLKDIDLDMLTALLSKSFQRTLSKTYFKDIEDSIHTIYLSERYTAAAIILQKEDCDIPYLCKFAVSAQAQGEGTGETVWEAICRDIQQLYWRSRGDNPINPWYFKKSEGSWSNGKWTVFWFGIAEPSLFTKLISAAISAPESFSQKEAISPLCEQLPEPSTVQSGKS